MANDIHKIKLLVLWDILCQNTDEEHALNTDEIVELLALRGINVSRKILVEDIKTLCAQGYEVLSYKKKYHYYYVVNRPLETAEVVMLADVINAAKITSAQKKELIERLSGTLCSHQAQSISKHIIALDKGRKGSSSFIYNVDAIERAINGDKQISFLYYDYNEKHKKAYRKDGARYYVNPVIMVWNKDNYYLLCFSNGHSDIVTYRLDKMENVKVEETDREPHQEYELFNTEEYRKQVFSMFGGELQNVR
ncbi:MAG: WYL domain-containing protein, partial [Bacteroidales bacterium]|nr:WYL domain-containing protein [Bacteroidales bacterium]